MGSVPGVLSVVNNERATIMTRPLAISAISAIVLITQLSACGREEKVVEPVRPVEVIKAQSQSGNLDVLYTGDVRARYETQLGFRVPGKVTARMVDVGALVKAGQVLARLDPADQQLGITAAREQMLAAQSNYQQAKADLDRFAELFQKGFISAAEFDRRKTLFQVAEAQVEQSRAQLGVNQNQSAYTVLRADQSGVVTAIGVEIGQVVAAGQVVMRIARPGEKEVAINVPEGRLGELKAATDVSMSLWSNPTKSYKARIREIAPSADAATRTYAVKVTILDADAAIQLGMTANVSLKGNGGAQVFRLPSSALFQKGNDAAVWVVDPKSSKVNLKPVKIASFSDEAVMVSGGINNGDVIVRAGVNKLFTDQTVRVVSHATP